MRGVLFVITFLIVFTGFAEAREKLSRKNNHFYQITLSSESLSATQLTDKLKELGARKAAKAELNTVKLKSHYFHFYLKRQQVAALFDYLQATGAASRIQKIASLKGAVKSEARFVIWLTNTAPLGPASMVMMTENFEKTRGELLQTWKPSQKSGARRVDVEEVNEAKIADLMKWGLKSGALQFYFDSSVTDYTSIPVFLSSVIPTRTPTPTKWDLDIMITPQSALQESEAYGWEKARFENDLDSEGISRLLTQVRKMGLVHIIPRAGFNGESAARVRVQVVKADPVLGTYFKSQRNEKRVEAVPPPSLETAPVLPETEADPLPPPPELATSTPIESPTVAPKEEIIETKIMVDNEEKIVKISRPVKHVTELHLFSSLLPTTKGVSPVLDTFIGHWFDEIGVRAHYLQLFNAPSLMGVRTMEASLQYRFPIHQGQLGQSLVPSLHYKQISTDGPQGTFLGAGLAYTDDMFPVVDRLLNILPFLQYPKTCEINFEYLPFSTTSGVTKVKAYVFSLRAHVYYTERFTLEGGIYTHSFEYEKTGSEALTNSLLFGELGVGYRF